MKKPRGIFQLSGVCFEWDWDDGSLSLRYPIGTPSSLVEEAWLKIPNGVWKMHDKYWLDWVARNCESVIAS